MNFYLRWISCIVIHWFTVEMKTNRSRDFLFSGPIEQFSYAIVLSYGVLFDKHCFYRFAMRWSREKYFSFIQSVRRRRRRRNLGRYPFFFFSSDRLHQDRTFDINVLSRKTHQQMWTWRTNHIECFFVLYIQIEREREKNETSC